MDRSAVMRRVKARDTKPEISVRRMLRNLGHAGYRLDRKDIPGRPDIAFIGRKKAIFVHGCFWHGHDCKRGSRVPKTNTDYWRGKIGRNKARDIEAAQALAAWGWKSLILWECELKDQSDVRARLTAFLQAAP